MWMAVHLYSCNCFSFEKGLEEQILTKESCLLAPL